MKITIEKNISMPDWTGVGRPNIYPFPDMEIGDSFALPLTGRKGSSGSQYLKWDEVTRKLTNAANSYAKKHNKKFTVREIKDESVARIWRVS
jgi:hypothetical protein